MRKYYKQIIAYGRFTCCILLVLTTLFTNYRFAWADESGEQTGSITIQYPVGDASFSIYKVGNWDEASGYTLVEPYSSYKVNMNSSNAASTLASYIKRDEDTNDKISPVTTVVTVKESYDEDAYAFASGLEKATYLIIGEKATKDGVTFTPQPLLVDLPYIQEDRSLAWNLIVEPKYEMVAESDELTELSVKKVWKSDDKEKRPESITIQLLQDGKFYESTEELVTEVVLDEAHEWSYDWDKLDASHTWSIVEKDVPEGYTCSVDKEKGTVVVTNTYDNPGNITPNEPEEPSKNPESTKKLPKTGQEWIPILMLVTAGLFFILIGLLLRKKCVYR